MPGNGKVFISHTHADNQRCEPLLAALDAWGIDYWFDVQQLDAGQQLTPRLQEAITQRDVLLRVCTANTASSYWMSLELSAFRALQYQERRQRSDQRRCIDLILDSTYTPGSPERADTTVDATNKPPHTWLAELAEPLGVKLSTRKRRKVSRRALVGLAGAAAVTAAALTSGGVIVKSRNDLTNAAYPKPKTIAFTNPQTLDKRIRWYFKAGDNLGGMGVALAGDTLILSTSDGLFGLDAATGATQWFQAALAGGASSAPVVVGSTLYMATSAAFSGILVALDAATGSLIWKTQTNSTVGDTNLSVSQNAIYMLTDDSVVVSFDARDGSTRWQSPTKIVASGGADRFPVASAGGVYVGGSDGVVTALSSVDGSLLWTFQTGGDVGAGVAVGKGVVYVGSEDQHLYALNAADGSRLWRYTAETILGAPTIAGSVLYLGIGNNLTAIDAHTGVQLWQAPTDAVIDIMSGPVTVAGDTLYAPADTYLYAFSAQKRTVLWRFLSSPSSGFDFNATAPVIAGSTAYWPGASHALYALDTTLPA
jgi:eukaryotic-like serine/threonine-protein kinase